MAKFASALGKFSGKGKDKDMEDALKPVTVTHYVKGNRMRTDNSDGTIQIIDLDGHRIIGIDPQKKSYGVVTFDELKAAMEQQKQKMQQAMQQAAQQGAQQGGQMQNPQLTITPKITVVPANNTRLILGQVTTETKIQMDMEMQAQGGAAAAPAPGQPNSATISMSFDVWTAPTLTGYQEFREFYRRMAKEVNWVPPTNIHIDPRMSQGMAELQKNETALKGLPMLSLVSMGIPLPAGQSPNTSTAQQNPNAGVPSRPGPDSADTPPTSVSDAVAKSLGGLFGKKKQASSEGTTPGSSQPNPSNPNSLMDLTTEVTSFSADALDGSLFDIPAGYTQVQMNPEQITSAQPKP